MTEPTTIIDIRGKTLHSNTQDHLKKLILKGLQNKTVPFVSKETKHSNLLRSIPTLVLYDDKGLDIFDKITYCEDYYLTNAEMDILQRESQKLVKNYVTSDTVLIELGCG
jgi:uncharacterized SAM-dependent methyltransferase